LEKEKYTLLWTVNQAIRQKITQKKTKEESKNGVPGQKLIFLEKWDFFCLEVNKEKVATYYHFLFIFHGQLIFCPEVVFIKGCTISVVPGCCLVSSLRLLFALLRSPANEKSFFASQLSLSLYLHHLGLFWSRRSHVVSG
jgi:hypothetical protein